MTALKLFSIRRSRPRIIKGAGIVLVLAASAIFAAPHPARADSAPDWMREAAREKLPDYPKDAEAVLLLDDQEIVVKDNGDVERHERCVYKLLRPESRESYGYASVYFDNQTKISFFKAWTITPGGQELEVKEKDAFEHTLTSYEVFSDSRLKVLPIPEANVGSVVGYEVIQKMRPFLLENSWYFQETIPVHRARLTLQLPSGWEFSTLWANAPEQKPQTPSSNEYIWEVTDQPAIEIEPQMPTRNSVAGHMDVKFFPRDPALREKTTGTWQDIGVWYSGLIASQRIPTPAIEQKVAELTAGKPDLLSKIQALTSYTQQQIRYAAIEVGIGGMQPHAAGDVLANGYGDCKDKATLLNTMLKVIGVDSYNVMIDSQRGTVVPQFPMVEFDHSIVAIHLPDSVQDGGLFAVVNDPKLGRLLFFDPTDPYVPLGYLPSEEQDGYALVVTPEGGTLEHVPLLPPATNRLLRMASFTLSPSGDLTGDFRELSWGGPAELKRAEFLQTPPAQRAKIIEGFLGNFLGNFSLTNASIGNLDQFDQNMLLTYSVNVSGYAKSAGDLLILKPRVVGEKSWAILSGKPRKYPIDFGETTRQDDVFDFTLPAGYVVDELPEPVSVECPYGSYQSHMTVTGNKLEYKRTYIIKDIQVPTDKLPEVKTFLAEIAQDENSSAILKQNKP